MMRWFVFLALLIPGLAHGACTDCDASAGYATVTVNGGTDVDEVVEYFVVYLSDLPPSWHTAMSDASDTDGKSIRVADSTGVTQIACYPVGVNTATDTGCLLVDAVGMSATVDVDYRVYVGMSGATMPAVTDTYGRNAVFSGYAGYYLPGMSTADLTGAGRTLVASATAPGTGTSGYEGITAATYNGTSSYHKYEGTQGATAWPMSLETLMLTDITGSVKTAFHLGVFASATNVFSIWKTGSGVAQAGVQGNGGSAATVATGTMSTATWYHVANTRDSASTPGDTYGYFNGTQYTNTTNINAFGTADRIAIGSGFGSSAHSSFWAGRVAMAALSSSVRSANYISTINRMWATDIYTAGAWTANSTSLSLLPIMSEE